MDAQAFAKELHPVAGIFTSSRGAPIYVSGVRDFSAGRIRRVDRSLLCLGDVHISVAGSGNAGGYDVPSVVAAGETGSCNVGSGDIFVPDFAMIRRENLLRLGGPIRITHGDDCSTCLEIAGQVSGAIRSDTGALKGAVKVF